MTRRLLWGLSAMLTLLWLVAALSGASVLRKEFDEIFDSALEQTADRMLPVVVDDLMQRDTIDDTLAMQMRTNAQSDGYLIYQVRDASGRVLMHTDSEAAKPFPAPLKAGYWQNDTYRIFTATAVSNTIFVQVADTMAHRHKAGWNAAFAMMTPVLILVPATVLAAYWIIRRTLRPVDSLRQTISEKDSGNLAEINLDPMPPELAPIGRSVNMLLQRLRLALDGEREFTANSAHELRTPIAGALAQAQLLVNNINAPEARIRAENVANALSNLSALAEKLLQLSRADAGIGTASTSVDLLTVIELIIEDFNHAGFERDRLNYQRPDFDSLPMTVNADAFAIILRNMLENALRHGDPREKVVLQFRDPRTLVVTNGAEPLSNDELVNIRKRFYRASPNTPGSGLGLSIIERLAGQMSAEFTIASPAPGRDDGFEARLTLPA